MGPIVGNKNCIDCFSQTIQLGKADKENATFSDRSFTLFGLISSLLKSQGEIVEISDSQSKIYHVNRNDLEQWLENHKSNLLDPTKTSLFVKNYEFEKTIATMCVNVAVRQAITNVEQMMEKAKVEFGDKCKWSIYINNGTILNYLREILENPDFQNDPFKYMKAWKERRGNTEELRLPEDPVRGFLKNEIKNNNKNFAIKLTHADDFLLKMTSEEFKEWAKKNKTKNFRIILVGF